MSESPIAMEKCSRCGRSIEICACCDEPSCGAAVCYACLREALGEAKSQPHAHGG